VRKCLTDPAFNPACMAVREAAAHCMEALAQESSLFCTSSDLETAVSVCCRALENSTYDVRCAVASLVAALLSSALAAPTGKPAPAAAKTHKNVTVDEVLNLLASMFLKGGHGGFLKTGAGEMIRGTTVVTKEVGPHKTISTCKKMAEKIP
jgi:HEAT repeat-containing protein 5